MSLENRNQNDGSMYQKTALAAELYYIYNLSQEEVANKLGVSRPWVSKLLKRAEDIGIVRIEVMTPSAGLTDLEKSIEKKYKIKKAKVIKNFADTDIFVNLGKAAAYYIISKLKPNDAIGVSWGKTVSSVADQFIQLNYPDIKIFPLIGGIGLNHEILSNHVASKLAAAIGAQCQLLHAPAFTFGKEQRDILLKDPNIAEIVKAGENLNIAILGLGPLKASKIQQEAYISATEIEELEALGAVGDIACRFIDKDGHIVDHNIHNRVVACDLVKVRNNVRESIGITFGKNKVPVLRAALAGKWLDVLVTDAETAEDLI